MVQSFPANPSTISFTVYGTVFAHRPQLESEQRRAIRQTGEISGIYPKKGGLK